LERPVTSFSRRRFLTILGAGIAGAALARSGFTSAAASGASGDPKHLAWVWQFDTDGPLDVIRSVLARHNLGVILKTHDGMNWMGRWDRSPDAIHGPAEIKKAAGYFETNGIPFHTWCVVKGQDPKGEAQMCAAALKTGARSMVLDLEPDDGGNYWQGSPADALTFGRELRRLAPTARIAVAPDPRPWQVKEVPMAEFASFCDEIAPQTYWNTFDSAANHRLLRDYGFGVGVEGVTPELILNVAAQGFARYGKPIHPIGQGTADGAGWQRFVRHANSLGMEHVSVWRYGTASNDVWPLLRDMAPVVKPALAPAIAPSVAENIVAGSFPAYRMASPLDDRKEETIRASEEKSKQNTDRQDSAPQSRVKETGLFGAKGISTSRAETGD
jgi:hypothetical protein